MAVAELPLYQPDPTTLEAAVRFDHITVERGGISILDGVSASVPKGSCTAIIGPNGAGKTTLLMALLGEISYQGTIHLGNQGNPPRIGYVPQRLSFARGMPLTVSEFLAMGFQHRPLWFGINSALQQRSQEALALVKAEHLLERRIGALSGGELQRVLLALALLQQPDLLVLDEPSAGLYPTDGQPRSGHRHPPCHPCHLPQPQGRRRRPAPPHPDQRQPHRHLWYAHGLGQPPFHARESGGLLGALLPERTL